MDGFDLSRSPADWHACSAGEAVKALASPDQGLSEAQAAERRRRYGYNRLTPPRTQGPWRRFLAQFHNVLIYVLLGSAVLTVVLGHWTDAAVIGGVVLINAVIGFVQEGKAEQALAAIRAMLSPQATVLRDGRRVVVPAETLVPGDRVFLESGDRVPADLRVVHAKGLRIQEAALTGESVPVDKSPEPAPPDAGLADRTSMAHSGTLVTSGQGVGVVVATGDATEIGRIGSMLAKVQTVETPLIIQMVAFGRWLTLAILVLSVGIFAFGVGVRGFPMDDMVMAAVGIAVAAIPEGLPAIMTIILAIGVTRMARRNAIIRHLPAVETLGSVGVVCSDKTGTLTRNELTVQTVATAEMSCEVTGIGNRPEGSFRLDDRILDPAAEPVLLDLVRAGALCNDAALHQEGRGWTVAGDPTDGALLTLAAKAGLDQGGETRWLPRLDLIPFESDHKFMATLHLRPDGTRLVVVKGAPERVLEMCAWERHRDGDAPFDPALWQHRIAALGSQGYRVLALAQRLADPELDSLGFKDVEGGLTLLGLVGIIDPPRPEAIAAVAACRAAGIRVKMITGDHVATARAIGVPFGLGQDGRSLSGRDLDAVDDDALVTVADETDIFARTTPKHKLQLVSALQARGAIVAMTGDGVNDAPALKRADVGIAMGIKGTEAAKEAADMVLADDNFASITHAVEEGRTVYDNLRKAILFILPTNGGQAVIVLLAILMGEALPITPVQILWVNMVTAVTLGLALAFERPEADIMRRPPRAPDEPILTPALVWRILFVMALLVIPSFGLYSWLDRAGAGTDVARTVAVNTLVLCEIFYLVNARYIWRPVLSADGIFGSRPVLVSIAVMVVLQLAFTYAPPMQRLFGTAPLPAGLWAMMAGAALVLFLVVEAMKWVGCPSRSATPGS